VSRSIVRSKINAKYNAGGTGGGGSISLLTAVTAAQLLTLKNSSALVPGMNYLVTNAPIILLPGTGSSLFYIKAVNTDTLESCGTLAILISSPPNVFREIQCWYNVDTNTHPKYSDPYNNNTVEGWLNIQNFTALSNIIGGLTSPNLKNNIIINGATLSFTGSCVIGVFTGNYIDGGGLILSNVATPIIENNKLINSFIYLDQSVIARIAGNYLIRSSIDDSFGKLNALTELRYNYLNSSNFIVDKSTPGLIEFQRNTIDHSTIYLSEISSLYYINDNFIEDSIVNVLNFSLFSSINKNTVYKSLLQFSNANFQAFENNSLDNTNLNITGSITGGATITYNTIQKSNIQNTNCELNYCNVFGMGLNSSALLDTANSYNYCNYRLYEDSTFYAYYDVDNTNIPSGNYWTVPNGHETWVGKAIFYSSLGGGIYNLKTIYNPIVNHRYYIYMDQSFTRFDIDVSTGFFVFPLSAAGIIKLNTQYDFLYIDGRVSPIGTQTGGEHVVISYEYY